MAKSNADFSKLVGSGNYVLTPIVSNNSNSKKEDHAFETSDSKKQEKKRKRAERKKKYFDRKKATKEKERAEKEEQEFTKKLKAKLLKSESNNKNINFEDLPEEYRKLIGGDFEHTNKFKGLNYNLLKQTKDKIAKQQIEDIESAYNDTIDTMDMDTTQAEQNDNDNDNDISMIMDIKSVWAHNIHKSVMKYYCNNQQIKKKNKHKHKINSKFCNGMKYKFNVESDASMDSIPTEIMRSQIGYGLVLDDFDEFENDNIDKQLCIGYTPCNTIEKIKNSLQKNQKQKNKNNDMKQIVKSKQKCQKRAFSEMNSNDDIKKKANDNVMDVVDDFDIFEDVGSDYVCNINQNPKRRRVSFMTPKMEQINKLKQLKQSYFENSNKDFIKNSNVKTAAASILKSSLNKAKIDNAKIKRKQCLKQKDVQSNNNNNSLRGKLLSSGFSSYYDDDFNDDDNMNNYNSDDDDQTKKTITAKSADIEWKKMQEKFGESAENTSHSIKQKLAIEKPHNTPNVHTFFS